jgi:surface protein
MIKKTTLKPYMISQQIYLKKMSYLPEFVALYEIFPYIEYLALDNDTIRNAVKDYLEGGETRKAIIKKYGKMEDWNTSEVTDMNNLFNYYYYIRDFDEYVDYCNSHEDIIIQKKFNEFNEDISKWDTSNVNNMCGMFCYAERFNQPIGIWDVSKVTYMSYMFKGAVDFNQPIGNWNTSKVTDMRYMFYYAENFNQPIGEFDTSNVSTMWYMFYCAREFNQPIEKWDTSNVTDMEDMFSGAKRFNQHISEWDTSKVTHMSRIFYKADNFNLENAPWYHE